MSDSTGLIAISFLGLIGFWLSLFAGRQANEMVLQICTGVVDGTPVPTVQRWQMLYNMWVPYQTGGFLVAIWLAGAQLLMASLVANENVKFLAHIGAIIACVGSLFWLLTGSLILANMRSVLRQAEAD